MATLRLQAMLISISFVGSSIYIGHHIYVRTGLYVRIFFCGLTEEKRMTANTEGNVDGDNSLRKITTNNQKSMITPYPVI